MRNLAILTLALGALGAQPSAAQPAEAEAEHPRATVRLELEPTTITVGDPVRARLLVEWPAGAPDVDPRFPAWQPAWGGAEILDQSEVSRERGPDGRTIFRQDLRLTAFETGEINLPPMTVAIPLADETLEVATPADATFTVTSVLPEGEEAPTARGAAAVERLPAGTPFWWTTAVLSLLCAAAAAVVARHHPAAFGGLLATPRLPPYEELRQRLRVIQPSRGSEPSHTALSLALRTYLGRATGLTAVERTTSEIQRAVRRGEGALGPDLGRDIVSLLQRCDEAKFVHGHQVAHDEIAARIAEVERIATAIHEREQAAGETAVRDRDGGETPPRDAASASGSAG